MDHTSPNKQANAFANVIRYGERGTEVAPAASGAVAEKRENWVIMSEESTPGFKRGTKEMAEKPPFHTGGLSCILSLLASACSLGGPAQPPFEVSDSSGVEIVVSHGPVGFDTPWTVSDEALLRIGKGRDEDPYLFGIVRGTARLSDGSIVAMDSQWRELRRFDENGAPIVSFGGQGEGPGEFLSIRGFLQRSADTLIVLDNKATLTYFDPSGNLLRRVPAGVSSPADGESFGAWRGVMSDGVLWGGRYPGQQDLPLGEVYRAPFSFVISNHDRTMVIPLAGYRDYAIFRDSDGVEGSYYPAFGTAAVPSRHPVGLLVGDNETFSIDLFESDGTHRRRMVFPGGVLEPTAAQLEAVREVVRKYHEALEERRPQFQTNAAWAAQFPAPEVWPGFHWLVGDELGFVWALGFRVGDNLPLTFSTPSTAPSSAWVFHPDGYVLGSVNLPGGFIPAEIGPDYLLGVEIDSLGVYEVVLYGLEGRGD